MLLITLDLYYQPQVVSRVFKFFFYSRIFENLRSPRPLSNHENATSTARVPCRGIPEYENRYCKPDCKSLKLAPALRVDFILFYFEVATLNLTLSFVFTYTAHPVRTHFVTLIFLLKYLPCKSRLSSSHLHGYHVYPGLYSRIHYNTGW